jgi:hypothetical protein
MDIHTVTESCLCAFRRLKRKLVSLCSFHALIQHGCFNFDDQAKANLMTQYTGGSVYNRRLS